MAGKKKAKTETAGVSTWKDHLLLRDHRSRKMFGALLVGFSAFALLAMVSFLFTWKSDSSFFHNVRTGSDYFRENPDAIANWMKRAGAQLSFLLIYRGFGLAAFVIPYLIAVLGLRIYTGFKIFDVYNALKICLIVLSFGSLLLATVFNSGFPVFGGVFGFSLLEWLRSMLGLPGVILVLILSLAGILLWNFNFDLFSFIGRKSRQAIRRKAAIPTDDEMDTDIPEESIFEKDKINVPTPVKEEIPLTVERNNVQEEEDEDEPDDDDGSDWVVLNTVEDEVEMEVERNTTEEARVGEIPRQTIDTAYDPTLDLSGFKFPPLDLLKEYSDAQNIANESDLGKSKNLIVETLQNYNIGISSIKATIGPTVTLFEIVPAPGVKISKIKNLEDDIALSLAALGIRIIAPIPGKGTIGIEVPNKDPEIVSMRSVLRSKAYQESKYALPVCLGKTISNEVYVADLAKMPHMLMAGATGQGKSVGINALIVSLLYKKHPAELKFVLVDPKKVELSLYKRIERHYLAKLPGEGEAIITENKKVINTLNSLCIEMDNRYGLLQEAMVRNIKEYNQKFVARKLNPNEGHRFLPYIVVVIDEVADLIMTAGKEVEHPIGRLAQLARAIGIHLILATQRPSVNIITGTIKANFPARAAFRVTSKIDSRTILDGNGADQLIGKGDMLYSTGSDIVRLQCPFVDTPEVEDITAYIGEQRGYASAYILPEVQEEGTGGVEDFDPSERDALFEEAARIVVQHQQGSTSLIQRKLKVGYNRAGRLIDQLEQANVVGPFEGSKARAVLLPDEYALEQLLNELG